MTVVVKKSGDRQDFNAEKIRQSVKRAAQDAKMTDPMMTQLSERVTDEVVKQFQQKEEVTTSQLRKELLKRLDKNAKAVSSAWRRYDRTTKGK